jgi:hypothetical protein
MKVRFVASTTITIGLALAALPASAIDSLTGTYEGKFSCKGSNNGAPTKGKGDAVLTITEDGTVLAALTENGAPAGGTFDLLHIEETAKQDRSKVAGADCGLLNVGRGIALEGDVVIKTGSEKGTVKGSYIRLGDKPARIDVCTFTVKRTSTTDPAVQGCPAL